MALSSFNVRTTGGRMIATRSYAPSGEIGRKMQRAADLQARIQLLDAELRLLRDELLHHMESRGYDRIECGDFRASRKVRHAWTYSAEIQRDMLALQQAQKWEQAQGLATDRPTVYIALSTTTESGK